MPKASHSSAPQLQHCKVDPEQPSAWRIKIEIHIREIYGTAPRVRGLGFRV